MAEEIQNPDVQPQADAPKQFTEIELKAADQGWKPQDEWEGDPDAWRPAKEFLDRGELFKKIDDQNRTIKEFKRTLDEFSKHHARVRETEYKRALEELKAAKKEALAEGDADAVVDIDEKIALTREAQREAPRPTEPAAINPVFVNWVERNPWYETDKAARAFADRVGNELGASGMSAVDILSEVEKQVKQEFAHKFQNPRRNAAPAVEGSSGKGGAAKGNAVTFSAEERRVAERFARNIPGMTVDKYLAEIAAAKKQGV